MSCTRVLYPYYGTPIIQHRSRVYIRIRIRFVCMCVKIFINFTCKGMLTNVVDSVHVFRSVFYPPYDDNGSGGIGSP